jgi:hypothetical protein
MHLFSILLFYDARLKLEVIKYKKLTFILLYCYIVKKSFLDDKFNDLIKYQ